MEYRQADFSYWDTVERFTLTEAAWLWCDLEPPDDGLQHMPILGKGINPHPVIAGLPAKGQRAARAMWRAISKCRLIVLTEWPNPIYLIPRIYLRDWAEQRGERPRFLYPEPISSALVSRLESTGVDSPKSRRERQLEYLIGERKKRGWDRNVPFGGKAELKDACCKYRPDLFTDAGFDHFWKWARKAEKMP